MHHQSKTAGCSSVRDTVVNTGIQSQQDQIERSGSQVEQRQSPAAVIPSVWHVRSSYSEETSLELSAPNIFESVSAVFNTTGNRV